MYMQLFQSVVLISDTHLKAPNFSMDKSYPHHSSSDPLSLHRVTDACQSFSDI